MDPLHFARAQMGLSLAFHIVFAAAGIALPFLMVASDVLHRRTGNADWLELSKRLAKGTAILFAVGAVSGTVLSFELGLLWPNFMGTFGPVVGLPFSLEGFAFFTEAIFLGIYLYGRGRVSPGLHLFSGAVVALSGAASAFFVTLVNVIMNVPRGFTWQGGAPTKVDPIAAMFDGPWVEQVVHVLLSSYESIAFAMVGIHAFLILRGRARELAGAGVGSNGFHLRALKLSLALGCVTALLQPLSGDRTAKSVAANQPIKLAAMESQYVTERRAPLRIGGIPDEKTGQVPWSIEIPGGLSFLAFGDFDAEVKGLDDFPRDQWPPAIGTHVSFQVMVGAGLALAAVAAFTIAFVALKRRLPLERAYLRILVATSPLGLVAMEAGWFVTEFGRQPWIVRGYMRTAEAVTPFPYLAAPFFLFTGVYLLLGVIVLVLLKKQIAEVPHRVG